MDFIKALPDTVMGWAAAIFGALVIFATQLPKISNGMKADNLNGNVLDRLKKAEENIGELNTKIQQHAIELTQVQMMLVQAVEHMEHHETPVPQKLAGYVQRLKEKLEIA